MSFTIMIRGSIKHYYKCGFELESLHVIEKGYNYDNTSDLYQVVLMSTPLNWEGENTL